MVGQMTGTPYKVSLCYCDAELCLSIPGPDRLHSPLSIMSLYWKSRRSINFLPMFYFSRRVAWYDAYFAPSSVRLVSLTQVQITAWVSGAAHQPLYRVQYDTSTFFLGKGDLLVFASCHLFSKEMPNLYWINKTHTYPYRDTRPIIIKRRPNRGEHGTHGHAIK